MALHPDFPRSPYESRKKMIMVPKGAGISTVQGNLPGQDRHLRQRHQDIGSGHCGLAKEQPLPQLRRASRVPNRGGDLSDTHSCNSSGGYVAFTLPARWRI